MIRVPASSSRASLPDENWSGSEIVVDPNYLSHTAMRRARGAKEDRELGGRQP